MTASLPARNMRPGKIVHAGMAREVLRCMAMLYGRVCIVSPEICHEQETYRLPWDTHSTTHECTLHTGTVGIIAGTMESCPPPAQAQLAQHILYSRHETTNI